MPWLSNHASPKIGPRKLQRVLHHAFTSRVSADRLSNPLQQLRSQHPITSEQVGRVLFEFRSKRAGADDPLLFDYLDTLLRLKLLDASGILIALLETSRISKAADSHDLEKSCTGMPTCEERVFLQLMQKYATSSLSVERSDLHGLVYAFARWMHAVTEFEMGRQLQDGALYSIDTFRFNMYEALASLAFTVLSSTGFRGVVRQPWWRKRRATLVSEMQNFDAHVLQWTQQSPMAGRLQLLSTLPPFLETDADGKPVFSNAQILQYIEDLPVTHTRAALYLWLNACLCSRPQTDDSRMITYLQARYNGNVQSLVVDLLTASFDNLTNALRRKESEQDIKVVRSFICNKLPLLLSIVSGGLATTATVEALVQVSFTAIAMNPLPPISAGATEVGEKLKATRKDFLQACVLHGIVSDHTAGEIAPGPVRSPAKATKYTKEGLKARYTKDANSVERLVDELETMHGNAGAIATFIVETINTLSINADTNNLKLVCNMLIKRISAVDIILQYTSVSALLLPLCNQMNNWTHDQDQAEFTSGYEEFASMLLLVSAIVHRYGLTASDIGLQSHDSFVVRILWDTPRSQLPRDLSEEQSTQLATWIEGLFTADDQDDISGISDETMRGCPPQAFYHLVPTLFQQIMIACKSGAVSNKVLQGGLELLMMPLLLPSLIPGLQWIVQHAWEDSSDVNVIPQILEKLLKPSDDSSEATAMHKVILGIVADPLLRSVEALDQKKTTKKNNDLSQTLRPFSGQSRAASGDKGDIEMWVATPEGGIATALRTAIREQVAWVTDIGPTPPPKYTHRLYTTACALIGVDGVLDAIVTELKEQTKIGNGSYALDICTALVAAPTPDSSSEVRVFPSTVPQALGGPFNVRDALNLRCNNLQKLLKTSAADAESLIRLLRRAEAQLIVTQMPQIPLPIPMANQATDQLMADLGLGDENLASQDMSVKAGTDTEFNNAELAAVLDQSIDMTDAAAVQNLANLSGADPAADPTNDLFDLGMQIPESLDQMVDASAVAANSGVDGQGQSVSAGGGLDDDDIFEGLDMGNIDDFNF